MLRIIAGKLKGRKLKVPDVSRPITDRIRTSIFDTLSPLMNGANVLDLYAGSGAFSFEAISRGAKKATLIEDNPEAVSLIHQNAENTKTTEIIQVIKQKVATYLGENSEEKFDIVMLDPPFALPLAQKIEDVINVIKLLNQEGIIVFRIPSKERYGDNIPNLTHLFSKNMGVSCINYYRKQT